MSLGERGLDPFVACFTTLRLVTISSFKKQCTCEA
jgi:hypothetical protein